jgi:hypothetical protein
MRNVPPGNLLVRYRRLPLSETAQLLAGMVWKWFEILINRQHDRA